jgi:Ig-like domain from next to BRCA1 gene
MNYSGAIKLILSEDIRKLHRIPSTVEELKECVLEIFKTKNYSMAYNSGVEINSTSDLINAYEWAKSFPSLKIHLKLKPNDAASCLYCKSPIKSPVYQCIQCQTYICNNCESLHPHIMLKAKSVFDLKMSPFVSFQPDKFMEQIIRFEKKMMKIKVLSHLIPEELVTRPLQKVLIGWNIQNAGNLDWPEGSALMWRKGTLVSDHRLVPQLRAGDSAEVSLEITTPGSKGQHTGIWELVVRGIPISKLKTKLIVD